MPQMRTLAIALLPVLLVALLPSVASAQQEYLIGPGDVLEVAVVGESVVSGPVTVGPDGKIVIPLIGGVDVQGLTLGQATDRIKAALKDYIREPQLTVALRQSSPRRQFAYLLGQVARPGVYEMQSGYTVAELVAVAGGPGGSAALSRAFILRKSQTIPVNLEKLLVDGDTSANMALESGDLVIVPETKSRVVLMGLVNKPGSYIIKSGDRVVDVLSSAGGPAGNADTQQIGIIRQTKDAKPAVTAVNIDKFYKNGDLSQNPTLEPGDVIYVAKRGGIDWNAVISMMGGLVFPFLYLVK